jgi:hypothetical protein
MSGQRLSGNRCLCRSCGQYFNSLKGFDRHRVGAYPNSRRCLTSPEMIRRGMTANRAGFWITETQRQHRVKTVALQIPAALRDAPLGHQGGNL